MGCGASLPAVPFTQVAGGQLVNATGATADATQVFKDKVKLVLFASLPSTAHWIQNTFVHFLNYARKANSAPFEVLLVSWDRTADEFKQLLAMGPFWAVPFEDTNRRTQLGYIFQVQGPPALVLIDENDGLIASDGVQKIQQDPMARDFPWKPRSEGGFLEGLELE